VAALLLNRRFLWALILELAVLAACLGVALVVIFHGTQGGLVLDLRLPPQATPFFGWLGGPEAVQTDNALAFVSIVTMVGVLARGAGLLLLFVTPRGRRDPLTWFLVGGGVAGAAALAVFAQPGSSQIYFADNAIPLLALGSTAGLASLLDRMGTRAVRPVLTGLVAGVFLVLLPWLLLGVLSPAGGIGQAARQLQIAGVVLALACVLVILFVRPLRGAVLGTVVVALLVAGVTSFADTVLDTGRWVVGKADTTVVAKTPGARLLIADERVVFDIPALLDATLEFQPPAGQG